MTDDAPQLPDQALTLTGGTRIPLLGFGTWQIKGEDAIRATSAALEAGYRHLDTATVYGNEGEVGRALADSGVARDDVFVTTKCPPDNVGQELDTLRTEPGDAAADHVDLWLIHWPATGPANVALAAFVEAREAGLAKEIGVSNFASQLIDEVTEPPAWRRRSTRSSGARCSSTPSRWPSTAHAASRSRATARCAAARSTTRRSSRSPSGLGVRRPR